MRLNIKDLDVWYGPRHVLRKISLAIDLDFVVITGRNGAGKSTLLKCIFGVVPARSGSISVDGASILSCGPAKLRELGLSYMPQGGQVFPALTCRENLILAAGHCGERAGAADKRIAELKDLFPSVAERFYRKAGTLSGGERQLLSFWMAMMPRPRALLLDEPLAGVSGDRVDEWISICQHVQQNEQMAVLVVEQRSQLLVDMATRWLNIDEGTISLIPR